MDQSMVESFEFFPQALGYDVMLEIFGTNGGSELYSPLNGLLISKRIIPYFRNFSIVIVPIGDPLIKSRWKTLVLNEQLLSDNQHKTAPNIFDIIHGKELTFKGIPRPAARYAYFHYAVARIRVHGEKKNDDWDEPGNPRGYLLLRGLSALIKEMIKCSSTCTTETTKCSLNCTKEEPKCSLNWENFPDLMKHAHGNGRPAGKKKEVAKLVQSNLNQRMGLES